LLALPSLHFEGFPVRRKNSIIEASAAIIDHGKIYLTKSAHELSEHGGRILEQEGMAVLSRLDESLGIVELVVSDEEDEELDQLLSLKTFQRLVLGIEEFHNIEAEDRVNRRLQDVKFVHVASVCLQEVEEFAKDLGVAHGRQSPRCFHMPRSRKSSIQKPEKSNRMEPLKYFEAEVLGTYSDKWYTSD